MVQRSILIVGGGAAGWLTAAYLARHFDLARNPRVAITVLESPDIGIIGVGEGSFPTIRNTLRFLGVDEAAFVRRSSATFKQGIRFDNWLHAPAGGRQHSYLHPFEAPFDAEGNQSLVEYWLLEDAGTRPPFAEAMTIQNRVAAAQRAPKQAGEGDFEGPLSYAYHFDAHRLAEVLADRARELGVRHLSGALAQVVQDSESGAIDHVVCDANGRLSADLYVDCTGFRAELIGRAMDAPFRSVRDTLFANRALACKLPHGHPGEPLDSYTIAAAHAGGWIWNIGLAGARGLGCVYSGDHLDEDAAAAVLATYTGGRSRDVEVRSIGFDAGYRTTPWVRNCVAVGLAGGFLEPLESTGMVMIETAAAMIAELLPLNGPVAGPARRFNERMQARYDNTVAFLKLHYCLGQRQEPFWRDNVDPSSVPERLRELLDEWRYRPPGRFDFILDLDSFAWFNYQYILYGMGFATDLSPLSGDYADQEGARRQFERIARYGARAARELPGHRELIDSFHAA
ncbi:tryptophan halogenase family protein [Sphingomonas sp. FW199]|uniref:tryptophan halogenase family protein n=1 Tax=Sphingomonas sp. FW199 TaxID=3400217 RepID=UPI003CF044CF